MPAFLRRMRRTGSSLPTSGRRQDLSCTDSSREPEIDDVNLSSSVLECTRLNSDPIRFIPGAAGRDGGHICRFSPNLASTHFLGQCVSDFSPTWQMGAVDPWADARCSSGTAPSPAKRSRRCGNKRVPISLRRDSTYACRRPFGVSGAIQGFPGPLPAVQLHWATAPHLVAGMVLAPRRQGKCARLLGSGHD